MSEENDRKEMSWDRTTLLEKVFCLSSPRRRRCCRRQRCIHQFSFQGNDHQQQRNDNSSTKDELSCRCMSLFIMGMGKKSVVICLSHFYLIKMFCVRRNHQVCSFDTR